MFVKSVRDRTLKNVTYYSDTPILEEGGGLEETIVEDVYKRVNSEEILQMELL